MNRTATKNTEKVIPINQKVTCNTEELQQLLSCGRYTAVKMGTEAGARIQHGRSVLWNVKRVMAYVDKVSE